MYKYIFDYIPANLPVQEPAHLSRFHRNYCERVFSGSVYVYKRPRRARAYTCTTVGKGLRRFPRPFLLLLLLFCGPIRYISPCCRLALAPVTLGKPQRIVSEVNDGFARVTRLLNGYRAPDQRPACTTVFFLFYVTVVA